MLKPNARPLWKSPSKRRPGQLRMEALEARLYLVATANVDLYDGTTIPFSATEDTVFLATGTQTINNDIIARTSGDWRYFTDITRVAPDNVYPTDSSNRDWRAFNYDAAAPRRPGDLATAFGQWRGPVNQGFANGGVTDIPIGGANGTDVGAGYINAGATKTTVLARKTFSVTQAQIDSGTLKLNYVCDDGCVFYINGQEVHRINIGTDQVDVNEYAPGASANETFQAAAVDVPVAGLNLSTTANGNIFSVEVHNAAPNSSDIGVRVHLFTTSSSTAAPSLFANDTPNPMPAGAVGRLLDLNGNPVAGTTVQAFDAADPTIFAGTVTNFDPATGFFNFTPARNYSGVATFNYDVDDNPADAALPSASAAAITVAPQNDAPIAYNSFYTFGATASAITVGNRGAALIETSEGGYYYKDDGSDQDTRNGTWNDGPTGAFNPVAAGWKGPLPPQFGFGENDETTVLVNSTSATGNPVDAGALTYYFFRSFDIANPGAISALEIGLQRDDGAAVYLNGVRIVLDSLAEPYTYSTAGISPADDGQAINRFVVRLADFPTLSLRPTGNHLAVEIHQQSAGSSDVSFDIGIYEFQLNSGASGGAVGVLANDNDVDNNNSELTVSAFDATGVAGQLAVTINPNGTFTVTPASANVTGTFTIPYTVRDPSGATATGNLNITLSPAFPVTADTYFVDEDTTLDAGTAGAATILLPRSTAGWDFLDSMMNGLQEDPNGAPQDYPVDGNNRTWFHPQFNLATSTIGPWEAGATPLAAGTIDGFPAGTPSTLGGLACGVPVADGNCVTTYLFRRTFNIPSGAANIKSLHLRNIIDDGFRLYINGQEVQRHLLPVGAVTAATFATGNGNEGTVGNLNDNYNLNVDGLLVNGDNVIAIEVHQVNAGSSDAGIDLQLETWAGVLGNDGPAVTPPLTAAVTTQPTNGTVVLNGNGTFRYTPNANFSGTDSFQYTATDGGGLNAAATATITVRARPDAPVAANDTYSTAVGTLLTVADAAQGLLGNDTDPDEATPLTALMVQEASIQVTPPAAGTFALTGVTNGLNNGTFTFTPAAGFSGAVSVAYTTVDPAGLTSNATATITVGSVTCANDRDLNNNGTSGDRGDYAIFAQNFGRTGAGLENVGDVNCDGKITVQDLKRIRDGASPSPEAPAALVDRVAANGGAVRDRVLAALDRALEATRENAPRANEVLQQVRDRIESGDVQQVRQVVRRILHGRRGARPAANDQAVEAMFS